LVQAIKLGRLDPNPKKEKPKEPLFDIWGNEEIEPSGKKPPKIEAPKLKLPGHAESYNPGEEFLLNKEEEAKWLADDPEDRELDFLPQKYECLRKVKSYDNFIKERFERCLDLYLCPRIKKKKLNIDPENLIPKLPKISELRPFPTMQNFKYKGHNSRVRGISVHKNGFWLATVSQDGETIIWETMTGRILKR
jgi:ribosome biogenesis protein ERB1